MAQAPALVFLPQLKALSQNPKGTDMDLSTFFELLIGAVTLEEAQKALADFETENSGRIQWAAVGGNQNNSGPINVSADPGRSLVERVTNAIDAVLEFAHMEKQGRPICTTPSQAATAWFGVPQKGVGGLSRAERQALASNVEVRVREGAGKESRTVDVVDKGIGLLASDMPNTILSINKSNKLQKFYLAGTFGQGGSSTYSNSKLTLIASRRYGQNQIGFTLVQFHDLPADQWKSGYYAYLTINGDVPSVEATEAFMNHGTIIRHFGYELSKYDSPLGPKSLYGLLSQVLFDPVLPLLLDNEPRKYRRNIAGARARLNTAAEDDDDGSSKTKIVYHQDMFYIDLVDHGRIAIEYWLLEQTQKGLPTATFIDPNKPIILTLNGQNQCELSRIVVRKYAELPFLQYRLIVHVKCDPLTPEAKRALFTSTREQARDSIVLRRIQDEIISVIRDDENLERLNEEAQKAKQTVEDEEQTKYVRKEVARLLRIQGIEVSNSGGIGEESESGDDGDRGAKRGEGPTKTPSRAPRKRPLPPIALKEPPTFIKIIWDETSPITFYPGQERWLRIETDAQSFYHDILDPSKSKLTFNLGPGLSIMGSTRLEGGRLRLKVRCSLDVVVATQSKIGVELFRAGMSALGDSRRIEIVEAPKAPATKQRQTMPVFEFRPVDSPDDSNWGALGWPDDVALVASHSEMEGAKLVVYYSKSFPDFSKACQSFASKNPADADSFELRYRIWLAVHSYLLQYQNQAQSGATDSAAIANEQENADEDRERSERCRVARMAAMIATKEVQSKLLTDGDADDT